jgi:parvulin-like peptidyl-prolyl isomerase
MRQVLFGTTLTLLALLAGACNGGGGGTALDRDAFYRPPAGTQEGRHVLRDGPPAPVYDNVRMDLLNPEGGVRLFPKEQPRPRESVTSISEAVRQTIELPYASSGGSSGGDAAAPTTGPATGPADEEEMAPMRPGISQGVVMTIGAVVCEVNGRPIYADKVLGSLSKVFAAEAKQRDARSFRVYAQQQIDRQVRLYIEDELAYAAALRNLDSREQELAQLATMKWRQDQITLAGGSIERARAKAAADGYTFEEQVEDQFRRNMVGVYFQKRLFPRAQVRAEDMRRYYNQNVKTRFTEPDQAQFRLIKVDVRKTGGLEQAREKITNLRQRATRGEDFTEMARTINDDPNLMRSAGDVGWIHRGAYALDAVEEAVWKVQPGEVSEIVQVGEAFYLAKLENRKMGRVRGFDEDAVQKEVQEALRREMLDSLRRQQQEALIADAIVHPDPPVTDVVLEMAMRNYPAWAAE